MPAFSGRLVLVVGPSGAGKDSVLRGAAVELAGDPRFVFPRRVVTRRAEAGAEDHDTMGEADFEQAVAGGAFALWWRAHGLAYGIGREIENHLAVGRVVALNVSRAVLAEAVDRFPHVTIAEVTAPPELCVQRIMARKRESAEEAPRRVAHAFPAFPAGVPAVQIDNSGKLRRAVVAFRALLEKLEHAASHPGRHPLDCEDEQEDGDDDGRRLVVVE